MGLIKSEAALQPKPQVIINADDFGITEGVNRAVFELIETGVLSSTSVMANMPSYRDIVGVRDRIGVGVHFNLTVGAPVTTPGNVPSLVDKKGNFPGLRELLRRAKTGNVSPQEVEAEISAQVEALFGLGITPDHFDSHESILKYPFFMRQIRKVALRYGIMAVRTYTPRVFDYSRLLRPRKTAISVFLALNKIEWRRRGFKVASRSDSLLEFGLDYNRAAAKLRDIFTDLRPGVLELGVHPGYLNEDNSPLGGYVQEREAELRALIAGSKMIRESGVEIVRFSNIH